MPPLSFPRWNAWHTLTLGQKVTCGNRRPAQCVKITLSTSVETRRGASVPLCPSVTVRSVRQPTILKTAASSVVFREVLNRLAFRMHSDVPFDGFIGRYAAKYRSTNSFPTHSHVTSPPNIACRMRLGCSSILGACMTIRLLSTNATVCMYLGSVRIGSSLDSWTRRTNIGVQSVTHYCLRLRRDLSRGVCGKNETSSTSIG
jgi:hypothetical protein